MALLRFCAVCLVIGTFLISRAPARAELPAWQPIITLPETRTPNGVANGVAIDLRGGPTGTKWAYTVDTASHLVIKFGTGGKILDSWPLPGSGYFRARVAVDGNGEVYVATGTNYVYKYSSSGTLLARWGKFGGLRDLAIDRLGNVYLAQYQGQVVAERSPSGVLIRRWSTRMLWHGQSAGFATDVAVGSDGAVTIATTCLSQYNCAPRISWLAGGHFRQWVDALFPLVDAHMPGDQIATLGLGRDMWGAPVAPRDPCNNRFVSLQNITTDPSGRLYVAGALWPRNSATPFLGVGLGPGLFGCTHDGIGPDWTVWPLQGQVGSTRNPHLNDDVHGLAVDAAGTIYVAQRNQILKLAAG